MFVNNFWRIPNGNSSRLVVLAGVIAPPSNPLFTLLNLPPYFAIIFGSSRPRKARAYSIKCRILYNCLSCIFIYLSSFYTQIWWQDKKEKKNDFRILIYWFISLLSYLLPKIFETVAAPKLLYIIIFVY